MLNAYSKKLGIAVSNREPYLLELKFTNSLSNHLMTFHGAASYSLAEVTSGHFLGIHFADIASQTIPILRTSSIKYKKGCNTVLFSKAKLLGMSVSEVKKLLLQKRKALFTIQVKLFDDADSLIATANFEWFVIMHPTV